MIIGVCGYGYTGSGALLDLFREYSDFTQSEYDMEFMFPYYPDGLESLAHNLFEKPSRFMSPDIAILRFEKFMYQYARSSKTVKKCTHGRLYHYTEEFISEISDISWQGNWLYDFYQKQDTNFGWFMSRAIRTIQRQFEKINIPTFFPKKRPMRICTNEEKFYKSAKKFVNSIIEEMLSVQTERIILNQPFAANYPTKSFAFFDDPKAILVDRDPRDVYILSKRAVKSRSEWIPTDDVETFIKYYRWMHERYGSEAKNPNVAIIQYEDLIFNQDNVIKHLEKVIGSLGSKNGVRYFYPEVSINNTQLFYKYTEYEYEMNLIKKELPEYLYDFSDKPRPDFSTKAF